MALIKDPTHQYAMTVVVPVADDQVQPLRSLLNAISAETVTQMQRKPVTVLVPFHAVESLHYARFFLAVASEEHDDPAMLVLSTNFDGPQGAARRDEKGARAAHIRDLAAQAHAGLDEVFSYCMGYTPGADQQQLVAFLEQEQHQVQANTFYVGSSGRSRNQILEEYQFRNQIESAADRVAAQPPHNDPQEVRARIITELESAGVEIPPPFPAQPDGVLRHLLAAPKWPLLFLIAAADLLLAAVACRLFPESYSFWQFALGGVLVLTLIGMGLYITLRRHEKRDIPDDPGHSRATTNHVAYASSGENHFMQNQLTHLVDMKPGLFRMMTIRTVFWALQVLATNVFNRGKLGNIPSIHFARWVFLGSKRRVLFFSNFDNSWQSYLGDFVDQASTGLTAVWSNTKGYPRTRNLLDAGSRNSTAFLAWTRAHQLPTDVWYSAYPALSIKNVNDNTLLRRGIADPSCIPASDWLRALAGEDLEPQKTPEPPDSQPELVDLPVDDIQGLILKGYGFLEHAAFIMLRVTDPALARKWIAELPVTPASMGSNLDHPQQNHPQTKFVNVAFTHSGLTALELDKTLLDGFPVEFVEGSHDRSRSRILGDVGANDPENWQWGNEDQRVDVLLMVYCHSAKTRQAEQDRYATETAANGLAHVITLPGGELPGRKEHFGFRDGIAQPVIRGNRLTKPGGTLVNELAPGEFLLGYADGYRTATDKRQANVAFAPKTASGFEFSKGGSYLVFRQLEQDVRAFWAYCAKAGQDQGVALSAETVASKMVGRWPNGEPLALHPDRPENSEKQSNENQFLYLEDDDAHGRKCPFGSHLRRTNPRDWLLGDNPTESKRLSGLHRIMRRGRPYGPPLVEDLMKTDQLIQHATAPRSEGEDEARGLNFICFNANIKRQFEFVQQQWINNAQLSQLPADADPLMGRQHRPDEGVGGADAGFTIQKDPLRSRCQGLTDFVTVKGSSYFFMPPISALRYLKEIK